MAGWIDNSIKIERQRSPVERNRWIDVAVLLASVLLAGCAGKYALEQPKLLGHTVRGVPVDDSAQGTTSAGNTTDRSHASAAQQSKPPQRHAELAVAPTLVEGKPVNIYGEMVGWATPPTRITGDAGFQQHSFTDEGSDSDVAVDPTGWWIAYASTRHSEHTDIYLQRVDGTAVTELTSDAADDAYPSFSPDGKRIAFASTRAGSWQIYVMDLDGRNVVQLTNGNMHAVHPSFSPDGNRLAYCAIGSRSNQWELWTADLRSGEKRMIGYGLFPRWSPDRTVDRIAFQKARQRGGRWFSLWTLDVIEGEGRRLTEIAASTNSAIVSPSWSPDGKRLAFATIVESSARDPLGAKSPAEHRASGQQDIWTTDSDGGNRHRVTDGNGTNLSPYWGADNRIYFLSDRGGNECVWSVRADGVPATTNVAGAGAPVSPLPRSVNGDPFQTDKSGANVATDLRDAK